jgi:uncharacterized protein YkwD
VKFLPLRQLPAAVAVWLLCSLVPVVPAVAASYGEYARSLVQNLPGDAQFRPDLEALLADYANRYRATENRPPLKAAPDFQLAARAHAVDMMLHNFMGHSASTGQDFAGRMRAMAGDITRFPGLGENAARESQKTPVDRAKARHLFQEWIDSIPHRRTMLSRDYAYVSTGVVQRGNVIWAVQIFWAEPRARGLFSSGSIVTPPSQ